MSVKRELLYNILIVALFVCVVAVLLVCVMFDSYLKVEPINNEPCVLLADGWDIYIDDSLYAHDVTLPYKLKAPVKGKDVSLVGRLPDSLSVNNPCFSISTRLCALSIWLEGERIYSFDAKDSPWRVPVYGSTMPHFIRLPDSAAGQDLTLVMRYSSSNALAKSIMIPLLGSKVSVVATQMDSELLSLVFGYTFCIVGIVCLFTALGIRKSDDRKALVSFGWLEFALGVWVVTQAKSRFLLVRNPAIPMDFSYIALFILPVFLTNFLVYSYDTGKLGTILKRISYVFPIAYCIIGILQFAGVIQYADCLMVAGGALGVFLAGMFVCLLILHFKGRHQFTSFLIALSVLLVSVIAEESLLLLGILLKSATILHAGMALCGFILLGQVMHNISSSNKNPLREQMLLELAYTDTLTGFGNRASYDLKAVEVSQGSVSPTGIIALDMNNLKVVNDTYGHDYGDRVLHDFAMKLRMLMPNTALPYRTGGDEFIILIPHCDNTRLSTLAGRIESYFVQNPQLGSSVAVGSYLYTPDKGISFKSAAHLADDAMYVCKARMKGDTI